MSDKPSFKTLMEDYAAAYEKHDLAKVEPLLHPKVKIIFKGQEICEGFGERMKAIYTDHWAKPNSKVTVKEIKELDGEDGVRVEAIDHADNKDHLVIARYLWAKEGDKWLLIANDVVERKEYTP
jgi:hypothetical protein